MNRRCWPICPATPHRVAISNSRLISMDETEVTFRWKDYRAKGQMRHKTMTLAPDEFMRRFLLHVLPGGFHRIRHYGLIANNARTEKLALARELLQVAPVTTAVADAGDAAHHDVRASFVCTHRLSVRHLSPRNHHERQNLEMVKLFADCALAVASLGKCDNVRKVRIPVPLGALSNSWCSRKL